MASSPQKRVTVKSLPLGWYWVPQEGIPYGTTLELLMQDQQGNNFAGVTWAPVTADKRNDDRWGSKLFKGLTLPP